MKNPTYNADGIQTWKPQPGEYYEGGLRTRESYAGITAAVRDVQESFGCGIPKSYPANFAGIIAAIEDLSDCLRIASNDEINIGDTPPGWNNEINGDGSPGGGWLVPPIDGTLWFDTRQGRLMVAYDGEYWQTNGAEGLAFVGENAPTGAPVLGQSWYDTYNKILYVCTSPGNWEAVRGAVDVAQATGDVPLTFPSRLFDGQGNGFLLPSNFPAQSEWSSLLPETDTSNINTQADLNEFYLWSLVKITNYCDSNSSNYFHVSQPSGDNLSKGDLWYDRNILDLKVYDGYNWIPATPALDNQSRLTTVEAGLSNEVANRTIALSSLETSLKQLIAESAANNPTINARIDLLENEVDSIPRLNADDFVQSYELETVRSALQVYIDSIRQQIPDPRTLQTVAAAVAEHTEIENKILERVKYSELQEVADQIPDISSLATTDFVEESISNITTEYLPRTGGTLTGSFVVEKSDIAVPALDFSQEKWHSYITHKYRSNSEVESYASFGTNTNPWEYAWNFDSNEDFCWVNGDGNKVFSISKDGPACNDIILGDFQENDTTNGRFVINQIKVKEKLRLHDTALANHNQQISDIINGFYSQAASTQQLKVALYNAVNSANDFDSLKVRMLAALS